MQRKNRRRFTISTRRAYLPILRFFTEQGFISGFYVHAKHISVFVRYFPNGVRLINRVDKLCASGRRLNFCLTVRDSSHRPFRTLIVSTPKGLMLEQDARLLKIGGLLMFQLN
jgi:ribosomal protein S8